MTLGESGVLTYVEHSMIFTAVYKGSCEKTA